MNSRRLLRQNIASLTFLQAINCVVPLITLPYLVRVLKPAHFGLLSFVQGIVLYFDFFVDFGFNFSATRSLAACLHTPASISRIFWSTLFAKIGLLFVSCLALAILVIFTPKLRELLTLFSVAALSLLGTTLFPLWLFQGLERLKPAAAALGVARLLTIPAIILLVKQPQDYIRAGAIQFSVELGASLLAALFIFRRIDISWYRPSLANICEAYKQGWPLFLSGSALFISTLSTPVILGAFAGMAEVGYFSAADKLIRAAISTLNPLSQAFYPRVLAAKRDSTAAALRVIRKSLVAVMAFSIIGAAATLLFAVPLCRLILGKSFEPSIAVLQCLAPLPILFGFLTIFGTQTMLVFNMDATLTRIMFASAIVNLPLTALLSLHFGAIGAAVASDTVAILIASSMYCCLRVKGLHPWKIQCVGSLTPA